MSKPSLEQLIDNALVLLHQALEDANAPELSVLEQQLARSNNKVLAFINAVGIDSAYQYMDTFLSKQLVPTTSTGKWLRLWLDAYSMKFKKANPAAGNILITGTVGTVVAAGSVFKAANGMEYVVDTSVSITANGDVEAAITAATGGQKGNQPANTKLNLVNPIAGINSEAVSVAGLEHGTDDETDAEILVRLKQRLKHEPMGGAPSDYERWALEVPGITRAWGLRTPAGRGTAGVLIMADNNTNRLPTAAQKQAVYDYITDDKRGPAAEELFVIVPTPVYVDHVLTITPDTPDVRAAVEEEINDLYWRAAEHSKAIPHSLLTEAVSIAAGEKDHSFVSPVITQGGAIAVPKWHIAINRSVRFV